MSADIHDMMASIQAELADLEEAEGRAMAEAELAAGADDDDDLVLEGEGLYSQGPVAELPQYEQTMTDDELVGHIVTLTRSVEMGGDQSELANIWEQGLGYYYGDPRAGDDERQEQGWAVEQSTDVADVVESIMSQIMPTFESTCVFRFGAQGSTEAELSQDEGQAETESLYVNHVLMKQNDGYVELQAAFRDAMILRLGFFEVETIEDVQVEVQEYDPGVDIAALQFDALQAGAELDLASKKDGTVVATRRTRKQRLEFSAVAPEYMRWTSTHRSPLLDRIPFIGKETIERICDLIDEGYPPDLVRSLPTYAQDSSNVAVTRSRYSGETFHDTVDSQDMRPVRIIRAYPLIDLDGDGYAERRKIVIGGESVLMENTPVHDHPYSMCVPILRSHRAVGIGMFDRQKWVQDTKTRTLRATLDNFDETNVPELIVELGGIGQYFNDVIDRKKGGVIRVQRQGAVQYPPMRSIGSDGFNLMEFMNRARAERGGPALDMQTSQLASPQTAHGVEREVSSKELVSAFIASSMVATGFIPAVKKAHELLRRIGGGPVAAQVGKTQRITTNPSQWPKRDDVSVVSELTLGEKLRKQQGLGQLFGIQQQLLEKGQDEVLVDLQGVYNTLLDMARSFDLDNPAQYFVDPSGEQAQEAMQRKSEQAQMAQQQAQQQAEAQAMLQGQVLAGVEQVRNQGRMQVEAIRAQTAGDKTQADMMETMAKIAADMSQFQDQLAQQYDELRVKLTEIEAKYGEQESPLTGEAP